MQVALEALARRSEARGEQVDDLRDGVRAVAEGEDQVRGRVEDHHLVAHGLVHHALGGDLAHVAGGPGPGQIGWREGARRGHADLSHWHGQPLAHAAGLRQARPRFQKKIEHKEGEAAGSHGAEQFELVQQGSMTPSEYRKFTADLTNFMVYAAEPIRNERQALGWKVLAFLSVFFVLAWLLNKEYWKDVK